MHAVADLHWLDFFGALAIVPSGTSCTLVSLGGVEVESPEPFAPPAQLWFGPFLQQHCKVNNKETICTTDEQFEDAGAVEGQEQRKAWSSVSSEGATHLRRRRDSARICFSRSMHARGTSFQERSISILRV
jgi:hypothetical protein